MYLHRFLSILAALCFSFVAHAAVTKLPIPGGEVRSIIYQDANTVYAATQGGGVYQSTDGGLNWSRMQSSPANYVNQIAIGSGNTLYAATRSGVFSSSDAGASWSRLFSGAASAIAIQPGSDDTLVFGVPGAGIYRIQGGGTPSLSVNGLSNTRVSSLAYDPANTSLVYAGIYSPCPDATCDPQPGTGVYRSTDGGQTWTDITGNLEPKFVTSLAVTSDRTLFVSTRDPRGCVKGGVHWLPEGSSSWVNPPGGVGGADGEMGGAEFVSVDRFTNSEVWVGSCGIGLFRGVKQSGNWVFSRPHNVGQDPAILLNAAFAVGSSPDTARIVAAVRGAGLFTSADARQGAASVWTEASGLFAVRATAFHGSPVLSSTLYTGTRGAGVIRSLDSGASWSRFNDGFPGLSGTNVNTLLSIRELTAHPTDADKAAAIAGGIGGYPTGLFQADGSPGAWTQPAAGSQFANPIGLVYSSNDDTVVLSQFDNQGTAAGIIKGSASTGGFGRVLNSIGNGKLIASKLISNKIFLMTFGEDDDQQGGDGLGAMSTDGGNTWAIMDAEHTGFMRLGSYTLTEISATQVVAAADKGLFRSTDGGANWSRVDISGPSTTVFSGLAYENPSLFAVSRTGGFFCSRDNGVNWTDLGSSLPEIPVFVDLKALDGILYLVSDGAGVFAADPNCP
jgi:photosystem II stability/assembly factor-like uncharacterized protein